MSVKLSRRTLVQAGTAALASVALPSLAQSAWPSKPIRIIVPYTAGGFTDQMARLLQVGLQKQLGQPVVIDNKPGANSIIGVDAVAKSAPDGHTFGVVIPAFTANTTLYPKLPYDTLRDFASVVLINTSPLVLVVNIDVPAKSIRELIALAKVEVKVETDPARLRPSDVEVLIGDYSKFHADTGWEPKAVYEHLAWLRSPNVLPFPVHIVSAGDLRADLLAGARGERWASIPAFTRTVTPAGRAARL